MLLVDDDELVLRHLESLVSGAGFQVATATDGAAALAVLEREFAPIVILDRNMPGMDGLALCRAIRQRAYAGYVYLMPETGLRGAAIVAERLRAVVSASPIRTTAGSIEVTVSIGVSAIPAADKITEATMDITLRDADECLYRSKEAGRSCVMLSTAVGN